MSAVRASTKQNNLKQKQLELKLPLVISPPAAIFFASVAKMIVGLLRVYRFGCADKVDHCCVDSLRCVGTQPGIEPGIPSGESASVVVIISVPRPPRFWRRRYLSFWKLRSR